jgi:hypothetical protein
MKKQILISIGIGFTITISSLLPFHYVQKLLIPGETIWNLMDIPTSEESGQGYGLAILVILITSMAFWSSLAYVFLWLKNRRIA